MNYKVVAIDQGSEPPEFLAAINQPPSKGFAKEIRESMDLKFEVGGAPVKTRTFTTNPMADNTPQNGPLYTGSPSSSSSSASGNEAKSDVSKEALKKIVEALDNDAIPDGFEREMVIIGDVAYSVAEKVQTFLGKKQVERVLEPISSLPEGIFFAQDYVPRVYTQSEKVIAVELLKKK